MNDPPRRYEVTEIKPFVRFTRQMMQYCISHVFADLVDAKRIPDVTASSFWRTHLARQCDGQAEMSATLR